MRLQDLNIALRGMISKKLTLGWIKSHIGKVLLGANGQAHLNRFLTPNDNGSFNNFGVKPLQKISKTIDYELFIVFLPQNESETIAAIEDLNNRFFQQLSSALDNYISGNFVNDKIIRSSRTQIDTVLDDIFDEV